METKKIIEQLTTSFLELLNEGDREHIAKSENLYWELQDFTILFLN